MKQQLNTLVLLSAVYCSSSFAADGQDVELELPRSSANGAFVLRIKSDNRNTPERSGLQLWRAHEDGDYQLISRNLNFDALSQVVYEPGQYRYQLRRSANENGKATFMTVSNTQMIEVSTRSQVPKLRKYK
ncbi:hypothetical protein [Agaribacterium haliotis]|uniref:hypothetical protein n=1 Tax=Agaribacterium haliotis TaxID=2013869 RepID=UPI000BB554F4|nr:hypothetical protein [Agaribacterium haliotis]